MLLITFLFNVFKIMSPFYVVTVFKIIFKRFYIYGLSAAILS